MKLVISEAHEGLKAATPKVFHETWQRFRVHFMRNAMAHVGLWGFSQTIRPSRGGWGDTVGAERRVVPAKTLDAIGDFRGSQ